MSTRTHVCLRCGSVLLDGRPIVFPRETLPAFPCGFPMPHVSAAGVVVWAFDDHIIALAPDEARGVARALLELADQADSLPERVT